MTLRLPKSGGSAKANEASGYNYDAHFKLLHTENSDGTPKTVLLHKKSNGIVLHMLDVFDVFLSAHNQQGHLKAERTLAALKPQYYSAAADLSKIFVDDCAICHQKNSGIVKKKGAKEAHHIVRVQGPLSGRPY
jgi:hypothetical protein